MLVLSCAIFPLGTAYARSKIQFITDTETDATLKFITAPILRSANLDPKLIQFHLIRDNSLNAFVVGGMDVYIHTGLIEQTDDVGELIGVLAHEIGHISGGHVIKGADAYKKAKMRSMFVGLLGLGAGLAAGSPEGGVASLMLTQNVADRTYLSFSRAQEASADQAALKYMTESKMSSKGLETFFERLVDQELLPIDRQDEFMRTHPFSQNRLEVVHHFNQNSPFADKPFPAAYTDQFKRLKAKFRGYFHAKNALRTYKNPKTIDQKYGHAFALAQRKRTKEALAIMDELVKLEPKNPFFHEFEAQLLFESSDIDGSILAYRKAVEYLPDSVHLRMDLAHALLETKKPENWKLAKKNIKRALSYNQEIPSLWQLMAIAFGKLNQMPETYFAMAKKYQLLDDKQSAKQYLEKALKGMSKDSKYYIQLQDLKFQLKEES